MKIPGYSSLSTKAKQNLHMYAGGTVAVGLLMGAMAMVGGTQPEKKILPPTEKKLTELPGDQAKDKELWFGGAGREVKELKKQLDELTVSQKDANDAASRHLEQMFKERFGDAANHPQPEEAKERGKADPIQVKGIDPTPEGGTRKNPVFPGQGRPDIAPPGTFPPGTPNGGQPVSTGANQPTTDSSGKSSQPQKIMRVAVAASSSNAEGEHGATAAKTGGAYLPIGFMRAVILGGLDAPTGGQASSPGASVPVFLEVTDLANLPNGFKANVKRCYIVATGWGDVSSERAYLRTTAISCINKQGQTIESPIVGHVFGEDGKNGVRGRLLSKQGQILANALMSGVASGIGQAFAGSAQTISVSPLGSTTTPGTTPKDILNSSLGLGAGKAMDRLANYYITLAEKTFPVIEVDAGRFVDVAIMQGAVLDAPLDPVGGGARSVTRSTGRYGSRDAALSGTALDANSAD
jgi:conjugal transfer pilus assembly protein TraB